MAFPDDLPKPLAYSYVRMSTPAQLKGRSRDRQLEASRAYAEKHGLQLVEDYVLQDIGVSAFKGANLKPGAALGSFLKAVEEKKIYPGSYLLVESLDRISRQQVLSALSNFIRLIEAGINLVTLADDRLFTKGTTNELDLIYSIFIMSRAHEESRIKSQRISDFWAHRRAHAATEKVTSICPAWLQYSSANDSFEIIEERARIVHRIFEESASGIGIYSITRRLIEERIPPFGKSDGWHESYVAKILNNRSVLGEFQPHKILNGKRVPLGPAVLDYYPRVINDGLFYSAQSGRTQRRTTGAGIKGPNFCNLFAHLAVCEYCGAPMRFENKGDPPKGGQFLVCNKARRGLGCVPTRWRYQDFEASFLAFVQEIDLHRIVATDDASSAIAKMTNDLHALRGELSNVEYRRDKAIELFLQTGGDSRAVADKLSDLERQYVELQTAIADKEKKLARHSSEKIAFVDSGKQIKDLVSRLQQSDRLDESDGRDTYRLRALVAAKLRSLISQITVSTIGDRPEMIKLLESKEQPEDVQAWLQEDIKNDRYAIHSFSVRFKDGTMRSVRPSRNDPLTFDLQVVIGPKRVQMIDRDWSQSTIELDPPEARQD